MRRALVARSFTSALFPARPVDPIDQGFDGSLDIGIPACAKQCGVVLQFNFHIANRCHIGAFAH